MKFKIGDKVRMTQSRINEFRHHGYYGVAPGQIYTIRYINSGGAQIYEHGFQWRTDGQNPFEGGSKESDLILVSSGKELKSWSME